MKRDKDWNPFSAMTQEQLERAIKLFYKLWGRHNGLIITFKSDKEEKKKEGKGTAK